MRFGMNETGNEQLENQQLTEQSSDLTSKDREITDGERERLTEAVPDIEREPEISGDDTAKLSQDGPKLDTSEREADAASSTEPIEGRTLGVSESIPESRTNGAEQPDRERENSEPLDLSGPRFEDGSNEERNDGDQPGATESVINISDESEPGSLDKEELQSRWNNAIEDTLSAKEDDYRDKGLSEDEIASRLAQDRRTEGGEFIEDAFPVDKQEVQDRWNNAIEDTLAAKEDDYRDKGLSEDEIASRLAQDHRTEGGEFIEDAFPVDEQEVQDRLQNANDNILQAKEDDSRDKEMDASDIVRNRPEETEEGSINEGVLSQPRIAEMDDTEHVEPQESSSSGIAPGLSEALHDPELFTDHRPMDYTYDEGRNGKHAYGQLGLSDDPHRNPGAQREAGGEERRGDDDGGHLIGARFDGSPDLENIDAQNRNLNRGAYKREENGWADAIKNGDQVYANVETYKRDGAQRPDAYMGWTVTEHPDGAREWDAFSFTNESNEEQAKWAAELEELPDTSDVPNAMLDSDYERINQIADEEDKSW